MCRISVLLEHLFSVHVLELTVYVIHVDLDTEHTSIYINYLTASVISVVTGGTYQSSLKFAHCSSPP